MSPSNDLPPYEFEDVPPCYDADQTLADFNALSPDEQARLSKGIAQAASQDDALEHFKKGARAAADAVYAIDTMINSLSAKLNSLDDKDTKEFLLTLTTIEEKYRGVVSQSCELAIVIAQYAASFDKIVIKFCADTSLTVGRRKNKINEFIAKGETIKNDAKRMQDKFTGLTDTFTAFVDKFKTWASHGEKIQKLSKEIEEIDKKIHDIDIAMTVIGAGLAVTLPATCALALYFPLVSPWVIGTGCVIAGLEKVSLIGLTVGKNNLLNKKGQKKSQIINLQDSTITATRTQLEERGEIDLMTFSTNIKAIVQVWTTVQNDALLIKKWLEDGASDADVPEYMRHSLEEAVKLYARMGRYLQDYAYGVKGNEKRTDA